MIAQDSLPLLKESLQNLWGGVIEFLPQLVLAILVFIVGWLIAALVEKAIEHFINAINLDKLLKNTGLHNAVAKAGFKFDSGKFLGGLVKWFVIIVFLVASLDIIGLSQVNVFLREAVLVYLPNVIVAALILLVGSVLADATAKLVNGSAKAADIKSSNFLGTVARWSIWIFTLIIALAQLGVAPQFLQILFTGIIAMLALAGGLAFGLGGKKAAEGILSKAEKSLK